MKPINKGKKLLMCGGWLAMLKLSLKRWWEILSIFFRIPFISYGLMMAYFDAFPKKYTLEKIEISGAC